MYPAKMHYDRKFDDLCYRYQYQILQGMWIFVWERRHLEKRVKLLDYYSRKEGISGASILEKTVAERAKNELCIKSWGGDDQNFNSLDVHISL